MTFKSYISVKEIKTALTEINDCGREFEEEYDDGSKGTYVCSIQFMCDDCIDKFAGLLDWATDEEAEPKAEMPS